MQLRPRPLLLLLATVLLRATSACADNPALVVKDPAFLDLVPNDVIVEKVASGFRFIEGPVWDGAGGCLIFSDIPANRLYLYDPAARGNALHVFPNDSAAIPPRERLSDDPDIQIFRADSEGANGNTLFDGCLYTCEHRSRHVTRTSPDGVKTILEIQGQTRAFNSPNDIVIKRDGSVWFTDPTYGLEGRPKEQDANHVFCVDAGTHELRAVADDFDQPNGLCFSPDETRLYIADSQRPHHIRVFRVDAANNTLHDGRVFCVIDRGAPDGIRCDAAGNVWSSAGDGVHVFNPAGKLLGKILVPETPANLCFGGSNGDELYLTARTSLYRVKLGRHKATN